MMVTLGAGLPERFFDTRRALHLVAARVLGAARYQSVGKMGLVVVDGGIATPEFGGHRLALVDGLLHVNGSQHPLTTLGEACALAGVDPSADLPAALNQAGDAATEVAVDRQAFDSLIGWYVRDYKAGIKVGDIVARYGVDQSTVTQHVKRSGVRMRYPALTIEEVNKAAKLYQTGLSLAVVGADLGVDPSTVRRALVRTRLKMRDRQGKRAKVRSQLSKTG